MSLWPPHYLNPGSAGGSQVNMRGLAAQQGEEKPLYETFVPSLHLTVFFISLKAEQALLALPH